MHPFIETQKEWLRTDIPPFRAGDTLRVNVGDPILDQFGGVYRVIAAETTYVQVDRDIMPKPFTTEMPDGFWYAPGQAAKRIDVLVDEIACVDFDLDAAAVFGRLRSELEGRGAPIGPYDLLIAAHALCLGLTLVTDNVREFQRIDRLALENWR